MTVRWSEDEFALYMQHLGIHRTQVQPVSEKAFQAAVVRIARDAGYTFAYHTYRSTKSPSGFPDLILCHKDPGHVCYAVELKINTGQVTPAQQAWLEALAGCTGVVSAVWRPKDLSSIIEQLRGKEH